MNRLYPAEFQAERRCTAHTTQSTTGGNIPLPRVGGALSARYQQYWGAAIECQREGAEEPCLRWRDSIPVSASRHRVYAPLAIILKPRIEVYAAVATLCGAVGCGVLDSGRVDSTALQQTPAGPILRVTILGDSSDARLPEAREAIAHWNAEFQRLGRRIQFDSVRIRPDSVPDAVVRAASGEATYGGGPATYRLRARLARDTGDIIVILTRTDLISFSVRWRPRGKGVVGMRRADIPPLSLPNTVRNVVAHELGHVLGLVHNADSTTLMCGRPAPCRPAAFASSSARFFPLTKPDEQRIRDRWP